MWEHGSHRRMPWSVVCPTRKDRPTRWLSATSRVAGAGARRAERGELSGGRPAQGEGGGGAPARGPAGGGGGGDGREGGAARAWCAEDDAGVVGGGGEEDDHSAEGLSRPARRLA